MVNEIFHFLKFEEFIHELGEICFIIGKNKIFNLLEILDTTGFLTFGKALLILLPLYLQMLIM